MLHQLKNGDWVSLLSVYKVYALPFTKRVAEHMDDILPRVVAKTTDGGVHFIEFESMEEAEQYRDELAKQINSARQQILMGNQNDTTTKIH